MKKALLTLVLLTFVPSSVFADIIRLGKVTPQSRGEILQCFLKDPIQFDPKATGFDANNGYIFALLSFLSYTEPDVALDAVRHLGFTKVELIEAKKQGWKNFPDGSKRRVIADSDAVWAENDDAIIIAFEGTKTKLSVYTDLLLRKTIFGSFGMVHEGFLGEIAVAWRQINKLLKEVDHPKPIFLTGHSLGAALATLAAIKFLQQPPKGGSYLHGLYTFGSPKVGNEDFARNFENYVEATKEKPVFAYSIRFQHNDDIVPRLPFWGYKQIDEFKYFDNHGNLIEGVEAVKKSHHSFFKRYILMRPGINDHDMRYYLEDSYYNSTGHLSGCL